MKLRRSLLALAAMFLLATPVRPGAEPPPSPRAEVPLEARPVPLDPADPARRDVGPLRLLGAWELTSSDPRFGAISAIHVEGGRAIAIGDTGTWFGFAVPPPGRGRGLAVGELAVGPDAGGRKRDRDSESLAVHGDTAWIGFEGRNRVRRYRLPGFELEAEAAPAAMADWPSNGGAEAMVRLEDGRFLLFAEGREGEATAPAILFAGDPAEADTESVEFRYRPPRGYRVTDAALLPDGRLLVLHRRFAWLDGVSARLARVDPAAIREGEVLEGRTLAALAPPLTVDNMEALSVTREGGRTIVWIASDDNFNPLQRTLLMRFEWVED